MNGSITFMQDTQEIVQKEHPVLRKVAKEVPLSDIGSPKIADIINEMKAALEGESDGVGLAAPQIGYSLRIFIVAPDLFEKNKKRKNPDQEFKEEDGKNEHLVFINPEITKLSKEKKVLEEGCLSVRPLFGKIERKIRAKVRAYDEHGKMFERGGSGLLAQIFQHEVDHLNGILFIDKATDVKEMPLSESQQ